MIPHSGSHPRSEYCVGERCGVLKFDPVREEWYRCGANATHKVEEVVFSDDPVPVRHPFTQYVCCPHFALMMGLEFKP